MMKVFHRFSTQHDDLIHDVSYDFYGKRLATCSSDQKIKIWDLSPDTGKWTMSAEWKSHSGSVWKVAWAHPEYGQVIASCSFDRTVCIWEEGEDEHQTKRWQLKATLVDSRDSVTDIKFAPKAFGLRLATCSSDGYIRIYEALDIMNLSQWPLLEEFESQKGASNCISWNPNSFDKQMIALGSNDQFIKIWEYNEANRKWVLMDTMYSTMAPAQATTGGTSTSLANSFSIGGAGGPLAPSSLVSTSSSSSSALSDPSDTNRSIHDICWAPNMGRTYHLIATASKDHNVRIWKLTNNDKLRLDLKEVLCNPFHRSEVWRVEWNITGTILASSGDDGNVALWKCNMNGEWKHMSSISGEEDVDEK
ncbi:hypothetical protein SAMD00019534_011390, partial [Acytostelium subglobosum LB1]|uniref:hypothetical protein n=1 Tax=Acytostelium subglobosum LB1 TaxID=1410327 RepID=UPI000644D490